MGPDVPINCVRCGRPISAGETLCCQTHGGTIVASSYIEIRRLLNEPGEVELFHLRCLSTTAVAERHRRWE